jgi:hypothetical protein
MNKGKDRLFSWSVLCLSGLGEPLPLFLYVIILLNYLSYCKSAFGDRKLFQENYFFTKGIYRDF